MHRPTHLQALELERFSVLAFDCPLLDVFDWMLSHKARAMLVLCCLKKRAIAPRTCCLGSVSAQFR
jgi:hypothetical protein